MIKKFVCRHPQKQYGAILITDNGKTAPTILATDYKSPPILIIEYD